MGRSSGEEPRARLRQGGSGQEDADAAVAEVVVLPDARHAAPVECPERFNAVLAAFLARHAAPAAAVKQGA